MNKALFLDRDGVINVDHGYVYKSETFEFTPGLIALLKQAQASGYKLVVVTNQSGIGRGYYTQADFEKLTRWMLARLLEQGVTIAGVYYCPHDPATPCECRKPAPGMFLQAIKDHKIDPAQSWMIGDKESDIEAALAAGVQNSVLITHGKAVSATKATYARNDLLDTIALIN